MSFVSFTVASVVASVITTSAIATSPDLPTLKLRATAPFPAETHAGVLPDYGFTYQGTLDEAGEPANGRYDFYFVLVDAGGFGVSSPVCIDHVEVIDGRFEVYVDFGERMHGEYRELGIHVREDNVVGNCDDLLGYQSLFPRPQISGAPFAHGITLPYSGESEADGDSLFEIANRSDTEFASGIRGIIGDSVDFSFFGRAGVRGEANTKEHGMGVLGISESFMGVAGFGGFYGVFGRTDHAHGQAITGESHGLSSVAVSGRYSGLDLEQGWAARFAGRVYCSYKVGIGTNTPETELDVDGTTRTSALQLPTNSGEGKVLKSDAVGNATWADPNPAGSVASAAPFPNDTTQFLSATVVMTVEEGQSVFVSSTRAFGTTSSGGAAGLDLYIGYRVEGSGDVPTLSGGGMLNMSMPNGARVPFAINSIIPNLPAGTYRFGMVGDDDGDGNWNSNDWGYTSVIVLD